MAKDGTNRDGRRVRAGAKLDPLNEKLAAGRPATRLEDPLNEPFDFEGGDIGAGAVLAGETMPEPSDYLFEVQRDGKPLGADLVYRETWRRLDARGCPQFVAMSQSFSKQANVYWYEIYEIVRATATTPRRRPRIS